MSTLVSPPQLLDPPALARDLAHRDLTDPDAGPHALQLLVDAVATRLANEWGAQVRAGRARPIVSVEDNYDRLRYSTGAVTRDARYSRYVSETCLLRTHTTAMVPPQLRRLASEPSPPPDVLLVCPGIVYRRDSIDRLHTGTPHQLDLWRVVHRGSAPMAPPDLDHMVRLVVDALMPGAPHRTIDVVHPYTEDGKQIDVLWGDEWVEIGECGVASPDVLRDAGLDVSSVSGLAMGLGLDRVLMLRKGIPDIRLLRSIDPRVAEQMLDLSPYRVVSTRPAVQRDLSIAIDGDDTVESLGDRVRDALGDDAASVELIDVVSQTPYDALPPDAIARLGMGPGQRNVLVRLVLRDVDRTLTRDEANVLRDRVYAALHRGSVHQWAASEPAPGDR